MEATVMSNIIDKTTDEYQLHATKGTESINVAV